MVVDTAIVRQVFEGMLPVVFTLSPKDLVTMKQPDPIYMMVPRASYFPLHADDAFFKARFQEFAVKLGENDEVWLEADGRPLKWHVPIGVQFDLLGRPEALPWAIHVRFSEFPADRLVRYGGGDAMQRHYNGMLKQAEHVRTGATRKIMNMTRLEQTQLWEGCRTHNFDTFWPVGKQLLCDVTSNLKHVPFRLYFEDIAIQDLVPPAVPLNPAAGSGTRPTTLLDVLRFCLPAQFPAPAGVKLAIAAARPPPSKPQKAAATATTAASGAAGEEEDGGATPATASDEAAAPAEDEATPAAPEPVDDTSEAASFENGDRTEVLLQGVRPRPNTPFVWLSDHLGYPDSFLHIVVRRRSGPHLA